MDLSAIARALSLRPAETRLLLLTDFDGTLVELAEDPDTVELSSGRRDLIQCLARRPDLTVGVISGRRLADVRMRVGLAMASITLACTAWRSRAPGYTSSTARPRTRAH